ncbi:hypothetical protein J550_2936 [Acinetobacter sp. 230853]|nr:hypothetical protein J546_2928 [Acinetobacter sp. 1461402]EXB68449.1 hypothetical protein J550_2936 [Acinetobacter sp. 230853]
MILFNFWMHWARIDDRACCACLINGLSSLMMLCMCIGSRRCGFSDILHRAAMKL